MKWIVAGVLIELMMAMRVSAADPPVTAIAVAPDGRSVVTGSSRGLEVRLISELSLTRTVKIEFAAIHDLMFSPDGKSLAVAGGDPAERGIVQILNWPEAKPQARLEQHTDVVYDIDWSSDGQYIVSGGLDKQVLLWNVAEVSLKQEYEGHSKGVTAVCLIDNSRQLVSAGLDRSLRVWDVDSGELLRTLENHTAPVNNLALKPSSEGLPMIVSCGNDRTLRFWQPTIGRLVRFARLDAIPLEAVWLTETSRVAVATSAGNVLIVDAETAELQRTVPASDHRLYCLAVLNDASNLFAGSQGGRIQRVRLNLE